MRDSLITANKRCGYVLLDQGKHRDAVNSVLELLRLGDKSQDPMNMAYQCYTKLGFGPFAGKTPSGWKDMFQMWDHQRENDRQFGRNDGQPFDARLAAIDRELNQINREIAHGAGPAELQELNARRDVLMKQREDIVRRKQQR
jgi:hypothetical protein